MLRNVEISKVQRQLFPPESASAGMSTASAEPSTKKQKRDQVEPAEKNKTTFNDPIHGTMEFHSLLVKIIDTPQFQRLRYLKQLGGTYFVYPGASHNRFEHSLGVCYLAGKLARELQSQQPELNIDADDILCVEIAGLCHDLGHGPFSHLFDMNFIPRVKGNKNWKHEKASVEMLQHLIDTNKFVEKEFKEAFEDIRKEASEDKRIKAFKEKVTFIKELIVPNLDDFYKFFMVKKGENVVPELLKKWREDKEKERKNKSFLFEIVCNERNSVDVDKWDYFARDCYHLGMHTNFDHLRYMKFIRVIEDDEKHEKQICCRDKEIGNLYDMFNIRATLHRRAYQHKNTKIIEYMITEAFCEANEFLLFSPKQTDEEKKRNEKKKELKLSETINNMEVYSQVHDGVFHMIRYSNDDRLKKSRRILERIEQRKLYKYIGQARPKDKDFKYNVQDLKLPDRIGEQIEKQGSAFTPPKHLISSKIIVVIGGFDYGMKQENPMDKVLCYSKHNPDRAFAVDKEEVSYMLLDTFSEQYIRVFYKDNDEDSKEVKRSDIETLKACFKKYCEPKGVGFEGDQEKGLHYSKELDDQDQRPKPQE